MKIEEEWLRYRTSVMPENIHEVQYRETRRAFYAGVVVSTSNISLITSVASRQLDKFVDCMLKDAEGIFVEEENVDKNKKN